MKKILTIPGKSVLLLVFCLLFLLFSTGTEAAENLARVAVAAPEKHKGLSEDEVNSVSNYLESRIGGAFELYSRTALKAILREYSFNDSGLVADENTKSELDLKGVKYILAYNLSRTGELYNFSMQLVNTSTGRIVPGKSAAFEVKSLRMLYGKIDQALKEMDMLRVSGTENTRRVAILPVSGNGTALSKGDCEAITGKIAARLGKSGSFTLVDRADLNKIAAEAGLLDSDLAAAGQAGKIGNLKLADYLVIVKVPRFENRQTASGSAISGFSGQRLTSHIGVTVKALEVASGEIKCSGDLNMVVESTEFPAEERRNWTVGDYNNALFDRIAGEAAAMLLEKLDPIYVAAVEDGSIYLTGGENLTPGEILDVFIPGKSVVHPVTGKQLGTAERFAGTVKVVSTGGALAVAKSEGDSIKNLSPGAVCRRKKVVSAKDNAPEPAYPMAQ